MTSANLLAKLALDIPASVASSSRVQGRLVFVWINARARPRPSDIIATLNSQGHDISYNQVPPEVWDALPFPAAKEMREMMEFWEAYTYFGPDADAKIARAQALVPEGFTSFAEWASKNMPASASTVARYQAALQRADADAVEAVLADDATLITPHGYIRGREAVQRPSRPSTAPT